MMKKTSTTLFSLLGLSAFLALSACNNVVSTEKKKSTRKISGVVSGVEGEAAVTITSVRNKTLYVPANSKDSNGNTMIGADPYAVYELRTDGKNSLLDLCVQPGANGYCRCIYKYNDDNSQEIIDAKYVYAFESNIAYCPIDIYGSLAQLQVGIQLGDSQITNLVVANQDIPQDATTNPGFYAPVLRHQCYPNTDISYLFDPELMNPIESNDPRHVTNLNYYVTNAADAIRQFGLQSALYSKVKTYQGRAQYESFHCPTLMGYWDDTSSAGRSTAINSTLQSFSDAKYRDWFRERWLNEVIFSQASDSTDVLANNAKGLVMHDPRPVKPQAASPYFVKPDVNTDVQYRQLSNNSRTSFQLSKFQTSLFSVPVSSMRFPDASNSAQRCTTDDQKNCVRAAGVIGYAAPTEVKDSNPEACPDPALLPSGWTWKKLYQFVGHLPTRVRVKEVDSDTQNGLGLYQLGVELCNPGIKNDGSRYASDLIYPSCATKFSGLLCPSGSVAKNDGLSCVIPNNPCKDANSVPNGGAIGAITADDGCKECPFGQGIVPKTNSSESDVCSTCKVFESTRGPGSNYACKDANSCQPNSFPVSYAGKTYCRPANEFYTGVHASVQNSLMGGAQSGEVVQNKVQQVNGSNDNILVDRVFDNQQMCLGYVDDYNQAGFSSSSPDFVAKARSGRAGALRKRSTSKWYTESNALAGLDLYTRVGIHRVADPTRYKSDFLFLNSIWVDPFKIIDAIFNAITTPKPTCNGADCTLGNVVSTNTATPTMGPEQPRFTSGPGPVATSHIDNEPIDSSGLYGFNDYLFVVTPESVSSDALFNGDGDLKKYWPRRIRSKESCEALFANSTSWADFVAKATNPNSPELQNCLIDYTPLVSPVDSSGQAVNFPVCVPQPPQPL